MKKFVSYAMLAAFTIASPVLAADPVIGTWKLDVTKSTFALGPAPIAMTRVFRESDGLYRLEITTTGSDGKITSGYVVYREGKEERQPDSDPEVTVLAAKKIDNNTWDFDVKHGGKVTGHVHRVVSPDGKTLTVHNSRTSDSPEGRKSGDETLVFEKQ